MWLLIVETVAAVAIPGILQMFLNLYLDGKFLHVHLQKNYPIYYEHYILLPGLTRVFRPILYNFFTKYNKTSTFFWEGFWKKVFHNFRPNSNLKKFTVQTDTEKKIIIGQVIK